MTASVRLWVDYVSPYAFVAKAWAYELEQDYDITLEWRPYTLDIASFQGNRSTSAIRITGGGCATPTWTRAASPTSRA